MMIVISINLKAKTVDASLILSSTAKRSKTRRQKPDETAFLHAKASIQPYRKARSVAIIARRNTSGKALASKGCRDVPMDLTCRHAPV